MVEEGEVRVAGLDTSGARPRNSLVEDGILCMALDLYQEV